ncbi:MAG: hypothetical protein ACUVUG_05270 [Candidatus Aminicenantia bacterium]
MKKFIVLFSLCIFSFPLLFSQQQPSPKGGAQKISEDENPPGDYVYDPQGRRDPFLDLLAGEQAREKTGPVTGEESLLIGEIEVVGISYGKGQYWAIVSGPDGMPYFLKKGDRLFDGYVLSIDSNRVIFRRELKRPGLLKNYEDIVKKLSPEEEGK